MLIKRFHVLSTRCLKGSWMINSKMIDSGDLWWFIIFRTTCIADAKCIYMATFIQIPSYYVNKCRQCVLNVPHRLQKDGGWKMSACRLAAPQRAALMARRAAAKSRGRGLWKCSHHGPMGVQWLRCCENFQVYRLYRHTDESIYYIILHLMMDNDSIS